MSTTSHFSTKTHLEEVGFIKEVGLLFKSIQIDWILKYYNLHLCSGSEVFQLFEGERISDEECSGGHREHSAEHLLDEEQLGHTQEVDVGPEGQLLNTPTHTHIPLRWWGRALVSDVTAITARIQCVQRCVTDEEIRFLSLILWPLFFCFFLI